MPRTKRTPLKVIDYEKLTDELKSVYDSIRISFERKSIFKLREEAKLLSIESPTTLSKEALVKRMTDRVVSEYAPRPRSSDDNCEVTSEYGEQHITGIFEADGTEGHVGQYAVPSALVREASLRSGDLVSGVVADFVDKKSLIMVETIEGAPIEADRPLFSRLELCEASPFEELSNRAATLVPDLKRGERVMMPTMTIRDSVDLLSSFKTAVGLYVGLPPEDQKYIEKGSFWVGFDYPKHEETRLARLALERAKRLSERGTDVILVVHGFENLRDADVRRAIFGAGRCFVRGSLTVIADVDFNEEGGAYKKVATRIVE